MGRQAHGTKGGGRGARFMRQGEEGRGGEKLREAEAADVLHGVTCAMQQLAGHRENVRKHDAPELALFGGDEE